MGEIVAAIAEPEKAAELPLDIRGTAFEERVWAALRRIPVGTTATYGEIATAIGAPAAHRAVARACGANRIAVAIPCHRVVRADGVRSPATAGAWSASAPSSTPKPMHADIGALDWARIEAELDEYGVARTGPLFDATACREIAGLYETGSFAAAS